jgi:hypothetical protein
MSTKTTAARRARRNAELAHHEAQKAHFANPTPATWAAYREASRTLLAVLFPPNPTPSR